MWIRDQSGKKVQVKSPCGTKQSYKSGCRCQECKDVYNALARIEYANNSEFRTNKSEYGKKRYLNNKEVILAKIYARRENNKEFYKTRNRKVYWPRFYSKSYNRDKIKAYHKSLIESGYYKDRYRRNPKKYQAISKAYREKNKEIVDLKQKLYRQAHAERYIEYGRAWRQSNPEKTKEYRIKRRARKRLAVGHSSIAELKTRKMMFDDKCAYCSVLLIKEYDFDHGIPLTREGSNWPQNFYPSCKSCNGEKKTKTVQEYLIYRIKNSLHIRAKLLAIFENDQKALRLYESQGI